VGTKSIKNNLQIEKILYKELSKKKLTVLKVLYKSYLVIIFVYNDYKLYIKQKRQVHLYYKKSVCIQKTIEKFGLKKKSFFRFLKTNKIKKFSFVKLIGNLILLQFFYKRYFLC
jgi:hypothetical protein